MHAASLSLLGLRATAMRPFGYGQELYASRNLMSHKTVHIPAALFEELWPLSHVKVGPVLTLRGSRLTCALLADEGHFIYKIVTRGMAESEVFQDTAAFDLLPRFGFRHLPGLLKTRAGANYAETQERLVYVMHFVEGQTKGRSPRKWAQLADIAVKLHAITDYPYSSPITIESEFAKLRECSALLPHARDLSEVIDQLPRFEGLSQSVIHTDLMLHNTILKPNNELVLVDWECVGIGPTVMDLGYPLLRDFTDVDDGTVFLRGRARAFFSTYFAKRSLPELDKSLIFDVGLLNLLGTSRYGDPPRTRQHVLYALKNRELLTSVLNEPKPDPNFEDDVVRLVPPADTP